jgi:beta-galactosidase
MPNFSFSIDGEHFLLDGTPLQIRSAEMHPARIPAEYWLHRIRMAKAMGMNTIALYVMWNYHETNSGAFDFESGNRDIAAFMRACHAENMWVLLRPGPYVCAEWDLGGLPSSLLREPGMRLRTDSASEPRYMAAVAGYIRALAARIAPLMVAAGGPILMIQIENEFGSYVSNLVNSPVSDPTSTPSGDRAYLDEIRALWIDCGIAGPFYTEDGRSTCMSRMGARASAFMPVRISIRRMASISPTSRATTTRRRSASRASRRRSSSPTGTSSRVT